MSNKQETQANTNQDDPGAPLEEIKEKLEALKDEVPREAEKIKRKLEVEEYTLIALNLLALFGVWITNVMPQRSDKYWMLMFLAFGAASVVISLKGLNHHQRSWKDAFIVQPLHWLGGIASVLAAYKLVAAGRISYEGMGLVILVLLGLTTYLDGIRLGWRLSLTGLFLLVVAVVSAFIQENMWLLMPLGLTVIVVIVVWKKYFYEGHHVE